MKIGICGFARTGQSIFNFLISKGIDKILLYDDDLSKVEKQYKYFCTLDKNWDTLDYIIVSPGISKNHKVFDLKPRKISDIEFFYLLYRDYFYIAITGTNGKTTITTQISHIFSTSGLGNIGNPIFEDCKKELIRRDFITPKVLEISSFQLELQDKFRPNIAVFSNISEDHLEKYVTMKNYAEAKLRIFDNMLHEDISLINLEKGNIEFIFESGFYNRIKSKIILVSDTLSLDELKIFASKFNLKNKFIYLDKSRNLIFHNIENEDKIFDLSSIDTKDYVMSNLILSLSAGYFCFILQSKLPDPVMLNRVFESEKVRFCSQFIGKKNDIIFINDSKGTNPHSTAISIKKYKNVHLIAGGIFKSFSIDPVLQYKSHIRHVYLYGKDRLILAKEFEKSKTPVSLHSNLEESFNFCIENCKISKENVVILSPMCASLDQFKSFKERGEVFDKLVLNLI